MLTIIGTVMRDMGAPDAIPFFQVSLGQLDRK